MVFQKLMKGLAAQKQSDRRAELYRNLIRHEAKIGGKLFGPVQPNGKREFFCLDQYTWVWYEEWVDQTGQRQTKTTRYEFRGDTVLKSVNGHYQPIGATEAKRLREAIQQYGTQVYQQLYAKIPR